MPGYWYAVSAGSFAGSGVRTGLPATAVDMLASLSGQVGRKRSAAETPAGGGRAGGTARVARPRRPDGGRGRASSDDPVPGLPPGVAEDEGQVAAVVHA